MDFRSGALLVLGVLAISGIAGFFSIPPITLATPGDVVARKISEPVTLDGKATESFWTNVSPVEFPLTATVEGGGHVTTITMKMVNDGSNVYLLFQWSDPSESRISGGATNAAEDRLAVMISLDPGNPKMASPCMKMGTNGAALAGEYDLLHWKAARTDSDGLNFTAVTRQGVQYTFTHPYSFAMDSFGNTTARYNEGLTEYSKKDPENPLSKYSEYDIRTKGVWANGEWTLEMARKYTTPDPSNIDKQFKQGETFTFSIAVYDGGEHENEEIKSITSWHTAELSDELLPLTTEPDATSTMATGTVSITGGISFETAAIVAFGMLIVGFVAGMLVISRFALPKKPKK